MSKSKVFICIAISFAVGVLTASKFNLPSVAVFVFLGLCAAAFALSFYSKNNIGVLLALFLFCAGLGALRLQISLAPNQYQNILGSKVQMEGYVTEDADIRANGQFITFLPKNSGQNILISTTLSQEFFYGDWLAVDGKVEEVKNFNDFDYRKYLEAKNSYAVMRNPKILILKSHQLNPLKEFLLKIKHGFVDTVGQRLYDPQSSLLLGILIGAKKNLPKNIIDNFNNTGTSHIIAVSGFNITIIISALASLAYLFGRRASFWLAVATIVSFVVITGASASVLRAAVMGFLLLVSLNIGRQYAIVPSLFFAGLIMLIINPKILFWDVGFQLSFAATLGIIFFIPVLNHLTESWPKALGAKTLILTTLSAIIATLPIILFNFGTLSFSAPLVNLLVLPVVPVTMLVGFLAVLPFVGPGFAFVANWLLVYILKITDFFAHIPYSSVNIQISVWVFWLLIIAVFGIYFGLNHLNQRKSLAVEQTKLL
jgi:competence protein ComEC